MTDLSRRDFLKIAANFLLALSGLLGLGGLLRFLAYQTDPPPPTEFDLGPASDYPPSSRTVLANVPAILIHTQAGFVALSLVCTHLGCTLAPTPEGFACPCHGSQFDPHGALRRGPASRSLRLLGIEKTPSGHLILHTD